MEGSPAAKGGLKVGDTITSVGKHSVSDPSALITAVSQYGVGDQLNFSVSRRGANKTVAVTLGRRPAAGSPPPAPAAPAKPAPVAPSSGKARPYIGIALVDSEGKGPLTVDDVQAGSPAERFGLRPQDVIVSANGRSLKTIEDFVKLMGQLSAGDSVQFKIERDGWKSDVRVTLGTAK
jgi:serine protease Do